LDSSFNKNNVLGHFSARDNVALAAWRAHGSKTDAERGADLALDRLGLSARKDLEAARLSGGEAQRVAIARAIVNRPRLVLADEPTGSLDSENAAKVLDALLSVVSDTTALLVVTHDPHVAVRMRRTIRVSDGRLLG